MRRLTPLHVIAALLAFLALGGTATAAAIITGEDVRDGSLTGADLAANTIGPRELEEPLPSRPALTTPGVAIQLAPSGGQDIEFEARTVAEVVVPAGPYLMSAGAELLGDVDDPLLFAACEVRTPEGARALSGHLALAGTEPGLRDEMAVSGVVTTRGGRVELRCHRAAGPLRLFKIRLSAVRLAGAIHR